MSQRSTGWSLLLLVSLLGGASVGPASANSEGLHASPKLLSRVSQSVSLHYWRAHPEQAPDEMRERFEEMREPLAQAQAEGRTEQVASGAFNLDAFGLPQNEESITACPGRGVVLGGTNDYRGLVDPLGNFTGWHLSLDGGTTVSSEGLLPPVRIAGSPVPSGGDPVVVAGEGCTLYAASLNYDPVSPFTEPNGIGIYRTTPEVLSRCGGGADPSCWPTRRAVSVANLPPPGIPGTSPPLRFLDKEWIDVGRSGSAGEVVWAAYAEFTIADLADDEGLTTGIKAVRCRARDLRVCTDPISISGEGRDVQFADVTIGPDGRTYISWTEVLGELEQISQTFVHKLRVAEPGSTRFGPERVVAVEGLAIPFGGRLNANNFRIATYPKNEVRIVAGNPRVYLVWDACTTRVLNDSICVEPVIKLTFSDDLGKTWTSSRVLSAGGENYFPTISDDPAGDGLAVAYFTNRFDPQFGNRQDVELLSIDPDGGIRTRQRLTGTSNDPESDPLLDGRFIGDYIEVVARGGEALVHFNANYRRMPVLGEGAPVPQQDNFLLRARL